MKDFSDSTQMPLQLSSKTSFKTDDFRRKLKTLNFVKKNSHPPIRTFTLHKFLSTPQPSFHPMGKSTECIIIEDDENHMNSLLETRSISTEQKPIGRETSSPKAQSDEDCMILDKNQIDFTQLLRKPIHKTQKFLDFRYKEPLSQTGPDLTNPLFRDFRRWRRKFQLRERKNEEHLQNLLQEISHANDLKVSDDTLKMIIDEINRDMNRSNERKQNIIQIVEVIDSDEDIGLQSQILKQSTLPITQKNQGIRVGTKYQCNIPCFKPVNSMEVAKMLEKHRVWESNRIGGSDFEEIRKLVQSILKINSINEEFLCELVAKNNYKIQDTTKYCFENQKTLQKRFIEQYAGETKARRTRNSLYSKFS